MKILSQPIYDKKIHSYNLLAEMTMKEYYELVSEIMNENEFQRNRVRSSKSVYSLLKQDLITECIMPPIVLSVSLNITKEQAENYSEIESLISSKKYKILILDGLQRTFTIQEIYNDVKAGKEKDTVLDHKIRAEIYLGLNREGILYRMLTLNTGQTPMNLRHQIEIIYSGLKDNDENNNFKLIRDTDAYFEYEKGHYKFSEAIDGFTSFLESDYLQITREKLLTTIQTYDNLSSLDTGSDAFVSLLKIYTKFTDKINSCLHNKPPFSETIENINGNLFGKDSYSIFNKSQPLTGFGAAVARLIKLKSFSNLTEIDSSFGERISNIDSDDVYAGICSMLKELDGIRLKSKKIGNAQRCFFYYFFKACFDIKGDSYLLFDESVRNAKQAYDRDN